MANVALRTAGLKGLAGRAAGLLLVAGLVLGLNLGVQAQDKTKPGAKADTKKTADKGGNANLTVNLPKFDPKGETGKPSGYGFGAIDGATKAINDMIAASWESNKITPANRCSDYEFIRRVSLDLIGRIATVDEVVKFMGDPAENRRGMLVDRLVKSPEYSSTWATIWTYWLMTRTGERLYKDQINLWLEEFLAEENSSIKDMAEKLIAANGPTNDNGAVNYILAHLGATNAGNNREKEGQFDMVPVTARTIRLFLGYQIQCTQCHDHPFNAEWKQKHFWGVNAFFRQTERVGTPPNRQQNNMMGMASKLVLQDNAGYNKNGIVFFEKRNGVFLPSEAQFLDGARMPKNAKVGRRDQLAKFVVEHKNFSRAYVNRMWAHFFGRGMNVKPAADDFGEHNEVVQEELLNKLAEEFATTGSYNPRNLIRWITSSDAYNLKAVANKSNESAEAEPYFARMNLKMMSPEQLFESLMTATRRSGAEEGKLREDWMRRLTANFGDDEGNEGNYNGTVVQALLMMNGQDINQAISNQQSGTVQQATTIKDVTGRKTMDYLFLATLNRPATDKEFTQILQKLPLGGGRVKEGDPQGPLQDLFWALLNCNEFILNH